MTYELIQWILHFKGIGRKRAFHLLQDSEIVHRLTYGKLEDLVQYEAFFGMKARAILQSRNFKKYSDEFEKQIACGVKIVTILDPNYPEVLKRLNDPPLILYCKGNTSLLNHQAMIGVVGTRVPTDYGRIQTEHLVRGLAEAQCCVVSGMAMGIDACAHKASLKAKGDTVAVLGCGVDLVYPKHNRSLFKEIEQFGLIISEYKCGVEPKPMHFPERNRIIAGLSNAVLVMEASKRSGSLITAEMAMDLGIPVFALPGPIHSGKSEGCNVLIHSGAIPIVGLEELKADLCIDYYQRTQVDLSSTAERILAILEQRGAGTLDELSQMAGVEYSKVFMTLFELETQQRISSVNGVYHKRV